MPGTGCVALAGVGCVSAGAGWLRADPRVWGQAKTECGEAGRAAALVGRLDPRAPHRMGAGAGAVPGDAGG